MRKECVEFAAYKISQENLGLSSEQCWVLAESRLNMLLPDAILHVPSKLKVSTAGLYYAWNACESGSYGLNTKNNDEMSLYHCREIVEYDYHAARLENGGHLLHGMWFFGPQVGIDRTHNVASFIRETENRLKLIDLSTFQKGDKPNSIFITFSDFWKQDTMKLSFFTLMLRCGTFYTDENYQRALDSNSWCVSSMKAIHVFLSGRTKFLGTHFWKQRLNWCYHFNNSSTESAKQLLV